MTTNKQDIAVNSLINEPQKFLQSVYRFFSHSMITLKNTFLGFFSQSITPTSLKDPQTTVVVAEKMVKKQQASVVPATISDLPIEILSHILNFEPDLHFGSVSKDWNIANGWVAAYQITSSQSDYPNQTEFNLLWEAQQQEIESLIANKDALLANVMQSNLFEQKYQELENALKFEGSLGARLHQRKNALISLNAELNLLLDSQQKEIDDLKHRMTRVSPDQNSKLELFYKGLEKAASFEGTTVEKVCQREIALNQLNEAIILPVINKDLEKKRYLLDKFSPHSVSFQCSSLDLTRIPRSVFAIKEWKIYWKKVTEFDITSNKISILPDNMFEYLPHLEGFYANNNLLRILPTSIVKSAKLKEISLAANCLAELPEGIDNLPCLKILNITYNMLRSISESLSTVIANSSYGFPRTIGAILDTQYSRNIRIFGA